MKLRKSWLVILLATVLAHSGYTTGTYGGNVESYLLVDDFSGAKSTFGTAWDGFTDRVMGGVSQLSVAKIPDEDGNFVRMTGEVSLENNGGFIQIRLKLDERGRVFDGTPYKGIRLLARGEEGGYYIFLRTTQTLFPWKYYAAPVQVSENWKVIDIPWEAFEPGDYGTMADAKINRIKSIALVAYGKEFSAKIDLKEIGLY